MKRQSISAIEKGDIVLLCTGWQKLLGKDHKRFVVSVALVCYLLIFPGSRFANQSRSVNSRPNIVFILVDDLRWDELGIAGHPYLKTPNIDRLGREGASFPNAFMTTPLCSPSRAGFLTGQYPHTHGIIDNVDRSAASHRLVTFPLLLNEAGYETAFIGKWHRETTTRRVRGLIAG